MLHVSQKWCSHINNSAIEPGRYYPIGTTTSLSLRSLDSCSSKLIFALTLPKAIFLPRARISSSAWGSSYERAHFYCSQLASLRKWSKYTDSQGGCPSVPVITLEAVGLSRISLSFEFCANTLAGWRRGLLGSSGEAAPGRASPSREELGVSSREKTAFLYIRAVYS